MSSKLCNSGMFIVAFMFSHSGHAAKPSAPAATPRAMLSRLHAAIVTTLKLTELTDRLTDVSAGYIIGNMPEEFAAVIQSERAKWGKVIRQTGVKLAL